MEIENFKSLDTGKQELFIRFERSEKKTLIAMCKRRISDCTAHKNKIENNPLNEGQSHYSAKYSDLTLEQEWCQEFINLLS
jgi:hypothetical protein